MPDKKVKIKDWNKFQHFKDRRPPWIKLYRDLLDDRQWHELDPKAAKMLVMLWLIASENEGCIPDVKDIAFRLRLTETETKSMVSKLSHWLEQDDISPISSQCQSDAPETETETETEGEGEKTSVAFCDIATVFEHWRQVMKHPKAQLDDKRKKQIRTALGWGYSISDLCQAITGCSLTPHNMGLNDRGERYDSIELIFRKADQIDRFRRNAENPPLSVEQRRLKDLDDWASGHDVKQGDFIEGEASNVGF